MFHFYIPLKTSGNLWFSDAFRGYRSGTLVENGLIKLVLLIDFEYIVFEILICKYKWLSLKLPAEGATRILEEYL